MSLAKHFEEHVTVGPIWIRKNYLTTAFEPGMTEFIVKNFIHYAQAKVIPPITVNWLKASGLRQRLIDDDYVI